MPFAEQDIVKIVRQPRNQWTHVQGEVGYIDEIKDGMAYIHTMNLQGTCVGTGMGWVPLDCLAEEPGVSWAAVKKKLDAAKERRLVEFEERNTRWQALVAEVAKKYEVSTETALSIHKELDEFR